MSSYISLSNWSGKLHPIQPFQMLTRLEALSEKTGLEMIVIDEPEKITHQEAKRFVRDICGECVAVREDTAPRQGFDCVYNTLSSVLYTQYYRFTHQINLPNLFQNRKLPNECTELIKEVSKVCPCDN